MGMLVLETEFSEHMASILYCAFGILIPQWLLVCPECRNTQEMHGVDCPALQGGGEQTSNFVPHYIPSCPLGGISLSITLLPHTKNGTFVEVLYSWSLSNYGSYLTISKSYNVIHAQSLFYTEICYTKNLKECIIWVEKKALIFTWIVEILTWTS